MKADTFVAAARVAELTGDGPFAASANDVDVALVRTAAGWRAFDGRCPHQGALLGEGEIVEGALVCRNHRWRFAIDDGRRLGGPECLASLPVVERAGQIFVDVSGRAARGEQRKAGRPIAEVPGPRGLPLLGSAHRLDPTRTHLVLEDWDRRYGPTFQFSAGRRTVFVTSDLAMIEEALRARPETFRRSKRTAETLSEAGIDGVFNAEGEAWRSQRKLTVAALAQRHLKELYPHIATVVGRLERRLMASAETGETVDVVEEMKRFTVDVTTLIAFGRDVNTIERPGDRIQTQLETILPTIARRIVASFPMWRYLKLPRDRRFDAALEAVRTWLSALVVETRARLAADPARAARPGNFIEAMLVATDEAGKPFSDETVISNLVTILIAGEDTTAYSLSWAIHELCEAPRWREAIRREADDVLGAADVAANVDVVNRLSVANAVASETMRLRPAAPLSSVTANVDTVLGPYAVPRGTTILLLFRPAAVDPAHFADPEGFRPERWLDGPMAPHDVSAYAPFGSGPRMCPGRSLALIEMKAVLSMLYRRFDVERVGDAGEVTELFGFTMSPAGLRVRLKPRAA